MDEAGPGRGAGQHSGRALSPDNGFWRLHTDVSAHPPPAAGENQMGRCLQLSILLVVLPCAGCDLFQGEPPDAAALVGLAATIAAPAPAAKDAQDAPVPGAGMSAASAGFDPASVPVTSANLPPFPFFKTPEGLESTYSDKERDIPYDGQYFIAGDSAVLVEGRIFRDRFSLAREERPYSELEFHRNYENAIAALGGRKINTAQYTREVVEAAGGRGVIEKNDFGAVAVPDYRHDSYLLRTADKEYWIDISSGAIPLHGYVVVLERKAMQQSVAFLDAAAMQQAIDRDGRVALHVNFDVDKATLRPDAQPVVEEIGKLLSAAPALRLSIEGHTDDTGDAAHNQELSSARARSVLGALVGLGVEPSRLQSKGYGQDKPLADNGTEAGRAENRRVELVKR
jgi:outer membrane protein OmpA-like peptidoglycan-associated protein